jgi:hypothetical protein
VLVGTHCETDASERQISKAKADNWAQDRGIKFEEVSNKTGQNIRQFFERFVSVARDKVLSSQVFFFLNAFRG